MARFIDGLNLNDTSNLNDHIMKNKTKIPHNANSSKMLQKIVERAVAYVFQQEQNN